METKQDKRQVARIEFGVGHSMRIIAIDGSWYRECTMLDVSDTGALLELKHSLSGLKLDEFFLSLSSVGVAFRRCRLAWVNGSQMGVTFLKQNERAQSARQRLGSIDSGLRGPAANKNVR
ncbi:MAG: PilZ domain-containing protein [Xanthobacteraceae bacterium]|nr:PilZ domain-containing protein [Xanthobacteraceae bacterium]